MMHRRYLSLQCVSAVPCTASQSLLIPCRLRRLVGTETRTEAMRIHFQNASIPTRAAKRLKLRLSLKESQARQITAQVFGYENWTDLHNALGGAAVSPPDGAC